MSTSNVHLLPVKTVKEQDPAPVMRQPIQLPDEPPRLTKKKKEKLLASNKRNIITRFYDHTAKRWLLRQNRSKWAHTAVERAVHHMTFNTYFATYCEIYEEDTGIVHCQIKRALGTGEITIIPLRHPKTNYVDPKDVE